MGTRYRFCVDLIDVDGVLDDDDLTEITEALTMALRIDKPKKARNAVVELVPVHSHSGDSCGGCASHYSDGKGDQAQSERDKVRRRR